MGGMLLVGLGLGQLMQTLTIASQNAVEARDIGVATSSSTFFRQIGGTLGTAVIFSVLYTRIPTTIAAAFADPTLSERVRAAAQDPAVLSDPANEGILKVLQRAQENSGSAGSALDGDTSFLVGANHDLAAPFLTGFADATVTVFWVSFAVVAVAFVLSWFLKAPPLRAKSALQERTDAQAAEDAEDELSLAAQRAAELAGSQLSPDTASNRVVDPSARR